ncbi:neurogenic locus notch homolog protein 1-like [Lethenteron reissneri]|uniref:neurogenic locus notch homolog protein 1-like n=1 Tax=Lethenteron reissneri TaxID=7753 RepID=UPI002AB71341|nr:neurogenic locus notch homolog protein 1-like [Lethenteron reissneri]
MAGPLSSAVATTTTEPPTTPSVCQNNPCGNWGTCVDQPDDYPYYRCDCIPPWYGSNCEYYATETTTEPPTTPSVCQNNPCGNWGTCVDQPYDYPYYRCDCMPPWYGSNCESYATTTTGQLLHTFCKLLDFIINACIIV